jgi:mannose-6-phosphate isomerase
MVNQFGWGTLKGAFKTNSWGKDASESFISRFAETHEHLPGQGPLAELWFGVHPGGTSIFSGSEAETISLSELLSRELGRNEVSYLAKILSVAEILSIQLHPDSYSASELHRDRPESYPDASAKPEMAVALGKASLLCGVRPLEEIRLLLETHPAFRLLFSDFKLSEENDIRVLIRHILEMPVSEIEEFYSAAVTASSTVYDEILRSAFYYLGGFDSGMPIIYLLGYYELMKGDAVFIEPGVPHAYVSGDLFECMKCSDNVVRGGLTPKEVDRDVFCRLLKTAPSSPVLRPLIHEKHHARYAPPGCPFELDYLSGRGELLYSLDAPNETVLLVCLSGEGEFFHGEVSAKINSPEVIFMTCQSDSLIIRGRDLEAFLVREV